MSKQGFGMRWAAGDEFGAFMKESNETLGQVMKQVGLTK
jgi:hypothetical protein